MKKIKIGKNKILKFYTTNEVFAKSFKSQIFWDAYNEEFVRLRLAHQIKKIRLEKHLTQKANVKYIFYLLMIFLIHASNIHFNLYLNKAKYEMIEDGKKFYAEIKDLRGVWAVGKTLEECRENLASTLGGFNGPYQEGKHPYMIKGNISITIPNPLLGNQKRRGTIPPFRGEYSIESISPLESSKLLLFYR